jgi:hypothetical protein
MGTFPQVPGMVAGPFGSPSASRAEALVTGDEIGAPRPISVLGAGGFRVGAFPCSAPFPRRIWVAASVIAL